MPISINGNTFFPGPLTIGAAPLALPNGTAAAPGLIFSGAGAEVAGWYRSGLNQWAFTSSSTPVISFVNTADIRIRGATTFGWTSANADSATDLYLTRRAAASLRLGDVDAASPVAQKIAVQDVAAGTTDTAGAAFTIGGSIGTGTGAGGSIIFQTAPAAGGTASTKNTLANLATMNTTGLVMASGKTLTLGNAATTGLTAGVLSALTNASVVILDSTGQAYRIPCII